MKARVTATMIPTQRVAVADLEQLERVRLDVFALDGSRDRAADFEHFRALVSGMQWITIFRQGGVPKGMVLWEWQTIQIDTRQLLWVRAEDFFVHKDIRHRMAVPTAAARVALKLVFTTSPLVPIYYVSAVYPGSYIMLRDVFGGVATLAGQGTDLEKALIRRAGAAIAGDRFDTTAGTIHEHLKPSDRHTTPTAAKHREEYREYEALNPGWRDGSALVVCVKVSRLTMIPRLLVAGFKRASARAPAEN